MNEFNNVLINTTSVKESFYSHIQPEENKRILFSAPFGAGKSFFLRDFFRDKRYLTVTLFPVDYPVASNEDILELIKYDILNSLVTDFEVELELKQADFSLYLMIQSFIMHKMDFFSLGKKILSAVSAEADGAVGVLEGAKEMTEKYSEYVKQLSTEEIDKVAEYIAGMKNQKGSIRETDGITEMIKNFIERIKAKMENKPVVLILDDLDRLDPDHIFRLINIFTAHYDSQQERNKFGFDKVILVCDHESLGHMFRHKYGQHANFNGYIDKFYSLKPFEFDNNRFLSEKIDELMKPKMKILHGEQRSVMDSTLQDAYDQNSDHYNVFRYLLEYMIKINTLKIRNFYRVEKYSLPYTNFNFQRRRSYDSNVYGFLVLLNNLKQFFTSISELKSALEGCNTNFIGDYTNRDNPYDESQIEHNLIEISLPFVLDDLMVFNKKRAENPKDAKFATFVVDGIELNVNFRKEEANDFWNGGIYYINCSAVGNRDKKILRPNPFWFVLKAFDYCERKGILSK